MTLSQPRRLASCRGWLASWRGRGLSRSSIQSPLEALDLEALKTIYKPLDFDKHQIRLVELQPSQRVDAEVICNLKTASFAQHAPHYEALSYAWGDPRSVDFIKLDGITAPVTVNLATALRHLRNSTEVRVLWIDALCINQSDNNERAHQVKAMKEIYQNALATRVWLGLAGPDNDLAFDFFAYLAQGPSALSDTLPDFLQEGMKHLVQFKELFQRSWWSRVWVLQEVILGPVAFLHCGHRHIPVHRILEAYDYLRKSGDNGLLRLAKEIIDIQQLSDLVSCMRQSLDLIEDLRSFYLHTDRNQEIKEPTWKWTPWAPPTKEEILLGFIELLAKCRKNYATDARDKIYGLLGLAPAAVTEEIEPTYEISAEILFIQTAFRLIQSSKSLLLFSQISPHKSRSRKNALPTWVPDWDAPGEHCLDVELRIKQEKIFNACKAEELIVTRIHDFGVAVQAICVGEVLFLAKVMPLHCEYKDAPACFKSWEKFSLEESTPPTHKGDDDLTFSDAYWKTILNGAVPDDGGFNLRRLEKADLSKFLQWRRENKWVAGTEHDFALLHGRHTWNDYISSTTRARRLFRCAEGKLGLGPAEMRPGDLIFVLAGGTHPCILRPSKIHDRLFTLIGECYVDHFMDGYGVLHPTDDWRSSPPKSCQSYFNRSRDPRDISWIRKITLNRSRKIAEEDAWEKYFNSRRLIDLPNDNGYWQIIVLC
jgi:hypothetical protein